MPPVADPIVWLGLLWPELANRRARMERMDAYYTGRHDLPFLTKAHDVKMRDEFAQLLEDSRTNFCRLVVDAVDERLNVDGFRLSATSSARSDVESWETWQENQMDTESSTAMVEALVKGVSYCSVWAGEKDGDRAQIRVEDPTQMIVGYSAGKGFRQRAAALKVWMDESSGHVRANVYTAEGVTKFASSRPGTVVPTGIETRTVADEESFEGPRVAGGSVRTSALQTEDGTLGRWVELEDEFLPNPRGIDVVPVVPLRNRPRLLLEGESELEDVIPIQKQINGFVFLLALAGYFGAHKQRWASGVAIADGPDGKPAELLGAIDTVWQNENPNARFGEFTATDLGNYISAIEQKILHIAVTTRTPRHYLIEQGQSPSGDAIQSAESGLLSKVERKQGTFGEGFEETLRLARAFEGKQETGPDSEIVWRDGSIRSEGERVDAVIKKVGAGLIDRWQGLEDLGYTQTQIERMRREPDPLPPADPTPTPDPEPPPSE